MKIRTTFMALVATIGLSAQAQNVTYESVQIAQLTVDRTWKSFDTLMPAMYAHLEAAFQKNGISAGGTAIFSDELKKVFVKDSFTRVVAQTLTVKLSPDEQRQTLAFLQSSAGLKFQQAMVDTDDMMKFMAPLFKQACAGAVARSAGQDKRQFETTCEKL